MKTTILTLLTLALIPVFANTQEASTTSGPAVEPGKHIRLEWNEAGEVGGYLFESRPYSEDGSHPWRVQATEVNSVTVEAQAEPHEYRVRSVHIAYPESISLPSRSVVYPPALDPDPSDPSDPEVPHLLHVIGIDGDGTVWRLNNDTQEWAKAFQ